MAIYHLSLSVAALRRFARPAAVLALLLLPCPHAHANEPELPDDIAKLMALPEDKIDTGTAALIFAHEAYPEHVNVEAYSHQIDRLADEVRSIMPKDAGPDEARLAINAVLYQREGFHYDFSPDALKKPSAFFLPALLDTKLGTCATLPILYLAVAQRLGLPVYMVSAPQHDFLRIIDTRTARPNIEATSGGGPKSDENYIKEFHITDTAVKNGTYLRTMTRREYVGTLFEINADYWARHDAIERSIRYYAIASELDPHSDKAVLGLARLYMLKSEIAADNAVFVPSDENFKQVAAYLKKSQGYKDRMKDMGARWEDYVNETELAKK